MKLPMTNKKGKLTLCILCVSATRVMETMSIMNHQRFREATDTQRIASRKKNNEIFLITSSRAKSSKSNDPPLNFIFPPG